jgi:hypothetical protein
MNRTICRGDSGHGGSGTESWAEMIHFSCNLLVISHLQQTDGLRRSQSQAGTASPWPAGGSASSARQRPRLQPLNWVGLAVQGFGLSMDGRGRAQRRPYQVHGKPPTARKPRTGIMNSVAADVRRRKGASSNRSASLPRRLRGSGVGFEEEVVKNSQSLQVTVTMQVKGGTPHPCRWGSPTTASPPSPPN